MSIVTDHLADVNKMPIIMSLEAVKAGRASWRHDKPVEEATAVKFGEAEWLSSRPCCSESESNPCLDCMSFPEPAGMLVDCPRCKGLGLRQFLVADGIETEVCTTCEGTGEVDMGTAAVVQGLMDRADLEADREAWADETRWTVSDVAPARRFHDLLSDAADHHKHADASPEAGWKARQFEELLRLARATDARDAWQLVDRLATLAEDYS